MDLESAQRAFLLADAGVAALVGTRVYPNFEPQDAALPAVAYQAIGGPSGEIGHNREREFRQLRIMYTVTAATYASAKAVAAAIRTALWGYRGTLSGSAYCYSCEVTADLDGYNQPNQLQTVRLDGVFLYHE